MLDKETIERQLAEVRAQLAQVNDHRTALLDIEKGFVLLLKTMQPPAYATEPPVRPLTKVAPAAGSAAKTNRSAPVGTISMRSAVANVVRSAQRPMHTNDILAEALRMGAATNSKAPASTVDLVLFNLAQKGKVHKIAPRTWEWDELADI